MKKNGFNIPMSDQFCYRCQQKYLAYLAVISRTILNYGDIGLRALHVYFHRSLSLLASAFMLWVAITRLSPQVQAERKCQIPTYTYYMCAHKYHTLHF